MDRYRSLATIEAVQFKGEPIDGITCQGSENDVMLNGCDASRKHLLHVHTAVVGGLQVLKKGDWIFAVQGGPWGVAPDAKFRTHWEVPEPPEPDEPPMETVAPNGQQEPVAPAQPESQASSEASAPDGQQEPVAPAPPPEPHDQPPA